MKKARDVLQKLIGHYDGGIGEYGLMSVDDDEYIESAMKELKELMPSPEEIAKFMLELDQAQYPEPIDWDSFGNHSVIREEYLSDGSAIHKLITERLV